MLYQTYVKYVKVDQQLIFVSFICAELNASRGLFPKQTNLSLFLGNLILFVIHFCLHLFPIFSFAFLNYTSSMTN